MNRKEMKKLDKILSEKARESGVCCLCGSRPKPRAFHPHHVIGRNCRMLRWVVVNIMPLCFACHRKMHENPMWAMEQIVNRYTAREYILLEALSGILAPDLKAKGLARDYDTVIDEMDWSLEKLADKYIGPERRANG